MCNKQIKFGAFLKKALEMGADYIATGHYARVREKDGKYKMLVGNDDNKDQTYFLWTLTQEQLKHTLFPTGEFPKSKVRELAEKFGLLTAKKKDSQGLCFIGKLDIADFLKNYIKEKKGNVLDESAKVIGEHTGVTFLTIGQRHGFNIIDKGINDKPYYIILKDIENNTITVSHIVRADGLKTRPTSNGTSIRIKDVNWVSGKVPDLDKKYKARIRYRQELQDCKIDGETIVFDESQNTVAVGQSIVVYNDDECLGGGIIS
jgi:tRNA-specific 2-thiouridylase